jgi:hypothetical protein
MTVVALAGQSKGGWITLPRGDSVVDQIHAHESGTLHRHE